MQHDVGDLVRKDRRELALVIGEGQDAARHKDIAAGQREGVDLGGVEHGDGELRIRLVGRGQELRDDLRQHDLGRPVRIDAAIGRNDLGAFARPDDVVLGIAGARHQRRLLAAGRRHLRRGAEHARAAGKQHQQPDDQGALEHRQIHGVANSSICSGWVMSRRGPSRNSIHPRTRTSAPPSCSGSSRSAVKRASARVSITAVKSSLK